MSEKENCTGCSWGFVPLDLEKKTNNTAVDDDNESCDLEEFQYTSKGLLLCQTCGKCRVIDFLSHTMSNITCPTTT